MGKKEFEVSLAPGGAHHRLAQMAGDWAGRYRIWFEPGKLADESEQRGHIRSVLGGRFMLHEYSGTCSGEPFEGIALYGHHLDEQRHEMAWAESFGTGTSIMMCQGDTAPDGRFGVLGGYNAAGQRWGWRTEISQPDADHLTILMFNITPDGQEALGVETLYERIAACPTSP